MYCTEMGGSASEAYHRDLLVVGLRLPVGGPPVSGGAACYPGATPQVISRLHQNGAILRVERLSTRRARGGGRVKSEPLPMGVATHDTGPVPDWEGLVWLRRGSDLEEISGRIRDDPGVTYAARVPVRFSAATGLGAAMIPVQPVVMWNLHRIRLGSARAAPGFVDATDVKVAVLDTGVDVQHPDLRDRVREYHWRNPDPSQSFSKADIMGHGTHVTGIIVASMSSSVGIKGICSCDLRVWKVFDDEARYDATTNSFRYLVNPVLYYRALDDCCAQGIDVVNLSLAGTGVPDPYELGLFRRLVARGTVVVAAMGNYRALGNPKCFPAAIDGVLAVGAVKLGDRLTAYSCTGRHICVCAPGDGVYSTLPCYPGQIGYQNDGTVAHPVKGNPIVRDCDYAAWDGTSMATPHVTAAVALCIANSGPLSSGAARLRLLATADRVPGMHGRDWTQEYGGGVLNLESLLRK